MNNHDIELPPLPQGEYRLSPDSRAPTLYDEEAMEAYARAAIEADRQEHLRDAANVIPMPTTKTEYIALLDLAIELGKKLNIAWEDALRASGQPAAPVAQEPVAYLDLGAGGYMDLGTDLTDEQLAALPKGRHMLAIIGTYGADGYVAAAPVAAQAQPVVNRQMTTAARSAKEPS